MTFEQFLSKYQKEPVEEYPNNVLQSVPNPIVSVRVSTYNHVNWIRECMDGILMQETHFPWEICIGDDESNDGTREICIENAKRHPDKIRLFLHKRVNNISVNGKPSAKFQSGYTKYHCRGKYMITCEGDDYWTDPSKLQKQVDFLEVNPGYSACAHRAEAKSESNLWDSKIYPDIPENNLLTILDSLDQTKMFAATGSVLYRNISFPYKEWMLECFMGDRILFSSLAARGPIHVLPDVMSVYRRHDKGMMGGFTGTSGKIKILQARCLFFRNIQSVVGNEKDVKEMRIQMLRRFTKMLAREYLKQENLPKKQRFAGVMGALWNPHYLSGFLVKNGVLGELKSWGMLHFLVLKVLLNKY